MRTSQKTRNNNARNFYDFIKSSYRYSRFAIIFEKSYSKTNPNIIRTKMIATNPSYGEKSPCVIAESILGYSKCFHEFLKSIGIKDFSSSEVCEILHSKYTIMNYALTNNHDKEVWAKREKLESRLGFEINIIDDYVMLLERK